MKSEPKLQCNGQFCDTGVITSSALFSARRLHSNCNGRKRVELFLRPYTHCTIRNYSRLRSTTITCHPTVCTPGFNLPRHLWSTLNRFRTSQGRRAASLVKRCQSPTSLVHRRRRIVIVNHCPSRLQLHGLVVVHGRCIELINTLFHGWACTANVRPTKRHTAKNKMILLIRSCAYS